MLSIYIIYYICYTIYVLAMYAHSIIYVYIYVYIYIHKNLLYIFFTKLIYIFIYIYIYLYIYIYIYIYTYMYMNYPNTTCLPGHHHNGFMESTLGSTHLLVAIKPLWC